jgi:hypothetical protein
MALINRLEEIRKEAVVELPASGQVTPVSSAVLTAIERLVLGERNGSAWVKAFPCLITHEDIKAHGRIES